MKKLGVLSFLILCAALGGCTEKAEPQTPAKERKYIREVVAGEDNQNLSEDGKGTEAKLARPQGLAIAKDGSIWMSSRGKSLDIRRFDSVTAEVTTIVSHDVISSFGKSPWNGSFNSKGEYYVPLKDSQMVLKITEDGNCSKYELTRDDAPYAPNQPMEVVFDKDDNMWLVAREDDEVVKIVDGKVVKSYNIKSANTLDIDRNGLVITVDANYKVVAINPENDQIEHIAGCGFKPSERNYTLGEKGNPKTATISSPVGISCASDGKIYIADGITFVILCLTPDENGDYSKGTVSKIAGSPFTQRIKDGGMYPNDLVVTPDNETIYVTDVYCVLHKIYKK